MRVWAPKKEKPDMPKGKKHTPEQIVAILHQVDNGEAAQAVCRELNISEATLIAGSSNMARSISMT
jgi:DNA-binding NarL/FixJ family response regulator